MWVCVYVVLSRRHVARRGSSTGVSTPRSHSNMANIQINKLVLVESRGARAIFSRRHWTLCCSFFMALSGPSRERLFSELYIYDRTRRVHILFPNWARQIGARTVRSSCACDNCFQIGRGFVPGKLILQTGCILVHSSDCQSQGAGENINGFSTASISRSKI